MVQSWTFGRKIALGFGLSVLILIVVGSVAYRSTDVLIENNARVAHTHLVLEDIAQVLSLIKDAETGQRGFVITGNDAFLEPYREALVPLPKTVANLRSLTTDNLRQQRRLDEAAPLIAAKLAQLTRSIDQRRTQGFEATQKVVQAGEAKKTMDDLRKVFGAMDQEE